MNNIQPYGAVSEEQVRKLERRYHIQLPAGYREFLLTYGGGKAEDLDHWEQYEIPLEEVDETISVSSLYDCEMISKYTDMFIDDMTENTLLIGDTNENGFFVLFCEGGENAGVVCYWDDSYTLEGSDDECNTYWVADSFEEFLAMLETPKK